MSLGDAADVSRSLDRQVIRQAANLFCLLCMVVAVVILLLFGWGGWKE